jgi:molybdopterin molybdotransferase
MLSLDDARARLLADVQPLSVERVALAAASGRVLAEDLVASEPLPRFDHSAMDGYAVATADLDGPGPWTLLVSGGSSAGATAPPLSPGAAFRIFTGAPIPEGADAVVMQEDVARAGDTIRFEASPRPGQHIRRAGEDLANGALALRRGTRLGPGSLALAAMMGRFEVRVTRRPRVTILCTGDELRAPDEPPRGASIPESNSAPLGALSAQAGAEVRVAPIARDDAHATQRAVEEALEGTDVLLTVGGVSVGDHDLVRPALERAGVSLDFWKVAMKPGKPLAVGRCGATYVLGLPGNPASALVALALFGAPLLRALQGDRSSRPAELPARIAQARKRPAERTELVRGRLHVEGGELVAVAHDNQASGAATSLASSDGLIVVPAGQEPLEARAAVEFIRWADV